MTTTKRQRPVRRPMETIQGLATDLRVGDYVDVIGDGKGWRRYRVGALTEQVEMDDPRYPAPNVTITFLVTGTFGLDPRCPVTFRRFTT